MSLTVHQVVLFDSRIAQKREIQIYLGAGAALVRGRGQGVATNGRCGGERERERGDKIAGAASVTRTLRTILLSIYLNVAVRPRPAMGQVIKFGTKFLLRRTSTGRKSFFCH